MQLVDVKLVLILIRVDQVQVDLVIMEIILNTHGGITVILLKLVVMVALKMNVFIAGL